MVSGNHVDELDNQLETSEFAETTTYDDDDFENGGGGLDNDSDVDLTTEGYEGAVKANPKRLNAAQRKKASDIIDGLIEDAELYDPEGQKRAWDKLHKKFGDKHPRPFKIDAEIGPNDVIDHPKFGIGFIVEQVKPTKVEVLFEDGLRKLACNIDV